LVLILSTITAADIIYCNGDVITINDAQPSAEAVAVKNGKILAVGSTDQLTKQYKGGSTRIVDLQGKTLLPGFIDPHSHFIAAPQSALQANVSPPPVSNGKDIASIIAALKELQAKRNIPKGAWIIGYGYDGSEITDKRELTRDDLDPAFPDNPVIVITVSMHGAVLNSLGLQKVGISAKTPTSPGGVIARKPGSMEPTGLVMEMAYLPFRDEVLKLSEEQVFNSMKAGQELYSKFGITTAQEGATSAADVETLKKAAARGLLYLDLVSYPLFVDAPKVLEKNPPNTWGAYNNHFKLGGVKFVADGSPQARTAYFTKPYLTPGPNGQANWCGEPSIPQAMLDKLVKMVYDDNLQILVHANGDATIDMFLSAYEKAAGPNPPYRRTTVVHSQFIRLDQLKKYVQLKLIPSFYTDHTFFFGDTHVKNLGKERAYFLSPMKTALALGLRPTNHTDFAVLPMDQMLTIWTAVNRTSRSGDIIGPDERVKPMDALRAITINAAYQYGEEKTKGSIEPGKIADLVILDKNPLKVNPNTIKDVKVLETIKEGQTVYSAAAA